MLQYEMKKLTTLDKSSRNSLGPEIEKIELNEKREEK